MSSTNDDLRAAVVQGFAAKPDKQGPRRVSNKEIEDAFADGWVMESVEPTRFEVRPEPNDVSFSEGGAKAWYVVVRKTG